VDQFSGVDRLLERLKTHLQNDALSHLRLAVAFAKIGPLLRLLELLQTWMERGSTTEAIFGVDQRGTSRDALEFALKYFDKTYVTHTRADSTFHPKFYLFYGDRLAVCIYGSHNLTVGGMETNLEGGIQIEMERPQDESVFQEAQSCWTALLPETCRMTRVLDRELLESLLRRGLVLDEKLMRAAPVGGEGVKATPPAPVELFPRVTPRPPSPIPRPALWGEEDRWPRAAARTRRTAHTLPTGALVIQIVPHHNGEVFLSKGAVSENPPFFGFPFAGRTVPKKRGNPSYPQRIPDPIVNVSVFGRGEEPIVARSDYGLNTVYYERKSEIRITFSPDLTRAIRPYAVMVMRLADQPYDYEIDVFNPESPLYEQFLSVCNETLPSGGALRARKYGWL
jgi:HKD family nuclease